MEDYRKSDQYYEDQYDLDTIRILKKLEGESIVPLKSERRQGKSFAIDPQWIPTTPFYDKAQLRARHREEIIRKQKHDDEHKDLLLRIHKEPKKANCDTCKARMLLCAHFFKNNGTDVVFVYECPRGHSPRKTLYSDGDEYVMPKKNVQNVAGR